MKRRDIRPTVVSGKGIVRTAKPFRERAKEGAAYYAIRSVDVYDRAIVARDTAVLVRDVLGEEDDLDVDE